MFDEVCLRLKYELPEPASAIHIRSTRVLFYFVLLPLMSYLTYKMSGKIQNADKQYRILEAMLWLMYLFMSLLALSVHYTFKKNKYFDKLHKREKVMKAVLKDINETLYPLRDVVWLPGKYGLFFYG